MKDKECERMMDALYNLGMIENDDAINGMIFEYLSVDTIKSLED